MAAPLIPELIRVPRAWFIDPVRTSLRKKVRPCTALTRRKQLSINTQVPFRTFEELLAGFADGELEGLERDVGGRLKTTNSSGAFFPPPRDLRTESQLARAPPKSVRTAKTSSERIILRFIPEIYAQTD